MWSGYAIDCQQDIAACQLCCEKLMGLLQAMGCLVKAGLEAETVPPFK